MFMVSAAFYFLSLLSFIAFFRKRSEPYSNAGMLFACAGALSDLVTPLVQREHAITFSGVLSMLSAATALVFLLIELTMKRTRVLGLMLMPIAFFLSLASIATHSQAAASTEAARIVRESGGVAWWMLLHIFTALVGYGSFIAAAVAGVLFIVEERQLKRHITGRITYSLPDIGTLMKLNYRCLLVGWIVFTFSLSLGHFWLHAITISIDMDSLKVALTHVTWLYYGMLLLLQSFFGWRGRKGAYGAAIGLALIVVAFVGINLFSSGLHSFRAS